MPYHGHVVCCHAKLDSGRLEGTIHAEPWPLPPDTPATCYIPTATLQPPYAVHILMHCNAAVQRQSHNMRLFLGTNTNTSEHQRKRFNEFSDCLSA